MDDCHVNIGRGGAQRIINSWSSHATTVRREVSSVDQ
jgi:hypothetical protein